MYFVFSTPSKAPLLPSLFFSPHQAESENEQKDGWQERERKTKEMDINYDWNGGENNDINKKQQQAWKVVNSPF